MFFDFRSQLIPFSNNDLSRQNESFGNRASQSNTLIRTRSVEDVISQLFNEKLLFNNSARELNPMPVTNGLKAYMGNFPELEINRMQLQQQKQVKSEEKSAITEPLFVAGLKSQEKIIGNYEAIFGKYTRENENCENFENNLDKIFNYL